MRYYSTIEAAKLLGLSRVHVYRLAKSKKITAEKIGRNFAIPESEIQRILKKEADFAPGTDRKTQIEKAVHRILDEYEDTLRKLAKD